MHSSGMRTARSSSRPGGSTPGTPKSGSRHSPGAGMPPDQAPPSVDRHTPVNILPYPKLRLRAVKIPALKGILLNLGYKHIFYRWTAETCCTSKIQPLKRCGCRR